MKSLNLTRINTTIYNTFLCIVLPLVATAVLAEYMPAFVNNFSLTWLFSLEALQGLVIFMCYAVPVTYFLSKAYEISTSGNDKTRGNAVLGFRLLCIDITTCFNWFSHVCQAKLFYPDGVYSGYCFYLFPFT
jgi:hypothetical protein